jgi:VCBS repeat-containing protein
MLRQQCQEVLNALQTFNAQFAAVLPATVKASIDAFVADRRDLITDTSGSPDSRKERVWAALVMLGALETQLSHLLADTQELLRSRADRAFEHLQRSIVVDPDEAKKWRTAFDAGETACEQLGAVRLLAHGIWAFKVNSEGERTDLVYPEPANEANVVRSADGLVLTEWKKANSGDNAARSFEQARAQGNLYAEGSLAGVELAAYRYAVVVSEGRIVVPQDVTEKGITYRHVNIAVSPEAPSRHARKASRTPK